jgi:O-antigen/teichoic acid export membrane protein
MGVIIKQSISNTIFTFIGFVIGACNALFLYIHILGETYYGLTTFILSTANLAMPFFAFGTPNTLLKFFQGYDSNESRSNFLSLMLILPIFASIPLIILGYFFQEQIGTFVSQRNANGKDFLGLIVIIAILMAYFEVLYAYAKAFLKSVFGNFLKEVLLRVLISIGLVLVYYQYLSSLEFIYLLILIYGVITMIMAFWAFSIQKPSLRLLKLNNQKEILKFTSFIVFSSSIALMLLELDKFMIYSMLPSQQNAYYSVATFIALTISVPLRAMHQITHPVTSELMLKKDTINLQKLYRRTSITLQFIGGLLFIGISCNISQIYAILNKPEYTAAIPVVLLISLAKYIDLMMGNNNSIIYNSKYYTKVLAIGIFIVGLAVLLNWYLIPIYGIIGAAIATLITLVIYNLMKLGFVTIKLKLFPFSIKTFYSFLITFISLILFYHWDFSYLPIINIILKSILISIFYIGVHYFLNISNDINGLIKSVLNKLVLFVKRIF